MIPDENPLQDAAGNDVPGFGPNPLDQQLEHDAAGLRQRDVQNGGSQTSFPGRNNEDQNQLTVTFNEELDPAFAPAGSAFSLRDGEGRAIAGIGTAFIDWRDA